MTKPYTALWSYPWDLLDEGLDQSLERIAAAGLDAIALAVSYHAGMLLLPHNPKSRLRFLEDGALYFRPAERAFADLAIQPRLSVLTAEQDPLAAISEAARRHGLDTIAWTICNHNSFQGRQHPELTVHTAYDDPLIYALCPAQPAVRTYLRSLVGALDRYSLCALQLESYGYTEFPHGHHHEKLLVPLGPLGQRLMSICFCAACRHEAESAGVDWRTPRDAVRRELDDILSLQSDTPPDCLVDERLAKIDGLAPYLALQRDVVNRLVVELAAVTSTPLNLLGIDDDAIGPLQPHVAEITQMAYRDDPAEMAAVARDAQRRLAKRIPLSVGIDGCPLSTPTPEALQAKIGAARQSADAGVYVYNYGLMPLRSLDWLKQALA